MARKKQLIEIEVVNWREHNPSENTSQWFKISTKMVRSAKYTSLSRSAKLLWIRLLSECAIEGSEVIRVCSKVVSGELGVLPRSVSKLLLELQSNKWIRIVSEPLLNTKEEKREEKTPTTSAEVFESSPKPKKPGTSELELAYALYPRKEGKKGGMAIAKREVKTAEDLTDLRRAIEKYARHVSGSETKYIKHFSTFMGEWRDWLDPEHGQTVLSFSQPAERVLR